MRLPHKYCRAKSDVSKFYRIMIPRLTSDRFIATVATLTFPIALLYPIFSLRPSLGDPLLDALYLYLDPATFGPSKYSVLSGIANLFTEGDIVIALVLLLFSVLFPAIKLALLWGLLCWPSSINEKLVHLLEKLGPWSMLDVFVVSVLVLAFKSFPGGTEFALEPGYYLFLISIISTLLATWIHGRSQSAEVNVGC